MVAVQRTYPESVFRRQAITALSRRPFGRPIAAMPSPWLWLNGFIVVFASMSLLFLATAKFSRKEMVRGWLVSRSGFARISHDAAGVVEGIAAVSGDPVRVGDPVIYLSRDKFMEDGRSSHDELLAELHKQVAAIERSAELLRSEAAMERDSIATQLQNLAMEEDALLRQQAGQQRRLDAAAKKLTLIKSAADKGAATDWEVLRSEDEYVALEQALAGLRQNEAAIERERERYSARARSLPVATERSISNLMSQRSLLLRQMTEQETAQRVVLKSPIAGRLASLEVHQGSMIAANQLLATVLPEDLTMVAEVYVPSSAIGFIKPGQRARLMYDAFPMQQFGTFSGKVERISESVLMPSETPQTFLLREATFKVQIAIEKDSIVFESGSAPLRPGMLLAAEIILESRSLVDWLLEPVRLRRRDSA